MMMIMMIVIIIIVNDSVLVCKGALQFQQRNFIKLSFTVFKEPSSSCLTLNVGLS